MDVKKTQMMVDAAPDEDLEDFLERHSVSLAVLEGQAHLIPEILLQMGVSLEEQTPVPMELIDPYVELFGEIFRESPP